MLIFLLPILILFRIIYSPNYLVYNPEYYLRVVVICIETVKQKTAIMSSKIINTGRYESNTDFWSAEIRGKAVTFHFGKIGRNGTRAAREFVSQAEAEHFVDQRLQAKIEEGFKLVEI